MKKRFLLAFLVLCVSGVFIAAAENLVFSPFVSGIEARISGKRVNLNWVDSPDVKGNVYIYRSREPFKDYTDHSASKIGEVQYGIENYIDRAPDEGKWYYLAAASEDGKTFDMVIPYKNMTEVTITPVPAPPYSSASPYRDTVEVLIQGNSPVSKASSYGLPETSIHRYEEELNSQKRELAQAVQSIAGTAPAAQGTGNSGNLNGAPAQGGGANSAGYGVAAAPRTAPAKATALTGLSAVINGNSIYISFLSGSPNKKVILYRSNQPIISLRDLLTAEIVQLPGAKSPYIDSGVPGLPYYYAVVYEEDIRDGTAAIFPGFNSTISPVFMPGAAPAQNLPAGTGQAGAGQAGARASSASGYPQNYQSGYPPSALPQYFQDYQQNSQSSQSKLSPEASAALGNVLFSVCL